MLKQNNNPIGVFDSGLGGLTVVKALMKHLPFENIVYFGDTARVPYGTKSQSSIIRFSLENAQILAAYDVKMIVVACNSSSSYALSELRRNYNIPIIGVVNPGAEAAVLKTKNQRVGVIATSATIHSQVYVKAINNINRKIKVYGQPCPLFVPLAEEGWLQKKVTYDIAIEYLTALKKKQIDTLILGCTHYPLLKTVLKKVMGPKVQLIDSAQAVATSVKRVTEQYQIIRSGYKTRKCRFLVSDKPQNFERTAKNFMGEDIKVQVIARNINPGSDRTKRGKQ